jgi:hypothetical protein
MPKHTSLSHKQMAANDEVKQAVVQAVAVESVERIVNAPAIDESPLEIGAVEEIILETPVKLKKSKKKSKTPTKTIEE